MRDVARVAQADVAGRAVVTRAILAASRGRAAPGTAPEAQMMYREKPRGAQKCANCIHFSPGKTADAPGICTVVAGSILPEAWCVAYAPEG